jgi:26S proteasome regulatory subunit T4
MKISTLASRRVSLSPSLAFFATRPRTHRPPPFHLSTVRLSLRDLERDYEESEDDIKALQSVGQIIGEVLKQLDEERCEPNTAARVE